MVSSGGSIKEAAALTNGQLLIGATGSAPVAAILTAGDGITITNTAGAVTISSASSSILQATGITTITTTSTTDIALSTPLSITPGAGDYLISFSGTVSNSNSSRDVFMSIFVNGTKIAASERQVTSNTGGDKCTIATSAYFTGLLASQSIEIRWRAESDTATITNRTLIVQRVK